MDALNPIGVERLSGAGSTVTWRFHEPINRARVPPPSESVEVEAPAKLTALQTYLYTAAKKQKTPTGKWELRFSRYYHSEKQFLDFVAYRFQDNQSTGQIRGIFLRIKKDLDKNRQQVVEISDPQLLELPGNKR